MVLLYACSLRPGELIDYPHKDRPPLSHMIDSSQSFFQFGDRFYSVVSPNYPPGERPSHFATILSFSKNNTAGQGGLRCIARSSPPHVGPECIDILFDYLRAFPPAPRSPILTGFDGRNETSTQLQSILTATATAINLHSHLLTPRSFRYAVPTSLGLNGQQADVAAQGHWRSVNGPLPYIHGGILQSDRVASAAHSSTLEPIPTTLLIYSNSNA